MNLIYSSLAKSKKLIRFMGCAAVAIISLIGSSPISAYATQQSTAPQYRHVNNGTVLSSKHMKLPTGLNNIATARAITYVSTDINGKKITVSGAVITPKKKVANAKTVAWGHGTTGIGDLCAPSQNIKYFWPEAVDAVASYIQKGWTVAATDYPGMGSAGAHPYLIGESEGRAVIDSVRAARQLDKRVGTDWVAAGHSQGGQAALFANQLSASYGTGLNLKGVVAIAPASNLDSIVPYIAGTPGQGYLVMALYGLAAVDPSVKPLELLAQPARDRVAVLQTGCYDEVLGAFAALTPEELLVGGVLPDSILAKVAAYGDLSQKRGVAPVLLVQGTLDEAVPVDVTYYLHSQLCSLNMPTQLHIIEGADHIGSVTSSIGVVSSYIQDRFAGKPAPSDC